MKRSLFKIVSLILVLSVVLSLAVPCAGALTIVQSRAKLEYVVDGEKSVTSVTLSAEGEAPVSVFYRNRIYGDKAVIGWQDKQGHRFIYENDISNRYKTRYLVGFDIAPNETRTLTAITTPVSVETEEVFSFTNSRRYFKNGYAMTGEHSKQLTKTYFWGTCFTPLAPIGVPVSFILPKVYPTVDWDGSCCGFPAAILMQRAGMIDFLSEQGVQTIGEIEPTEEIISMLNFYNATTPVSIIRSHLAKDPGSKKYIKQTDKMFETVQSGKPVMCVIDIGFLDLTTWEGIKYAFGLIKEKDWSELLYTLARCHCVLLTGAYTDGEGNKCFIGYDENYTDYSIGSPELYVVEKDYSDITDGYTNFGRYTWTDDISYLASFKDEGAVNPFRWMF